MTSVVEICNIGLTNLGDKKISSLVDNNERARLCSLRFPDVRDAVLRSYPWSCAVTRTKLARSSTDPVWGFSYRYALPSDCLRVLDLNDWNEEHYIENGFLVTDSGQAWIKYIKRIEDTGIQASNDMDIAPLFIPALVAGLAYNIALKKPEAADRVVMLKQMYDEAFQLCADENRVKATLSLIPFTQGFYGT